MGGRISNCIAVCWIAICGLALVVACSPAAHSQDRLREPRLRISGPDGQTIVVSMRYYRRGGIAKTTTRRFEIDSRAPAMPLESGHDGLRIFISVPTSEKVAVTLLDNGMKLQHVESSRAQVLTLLSGRTPASDEFRPPRSLFNGPERAFVTEFLEALARGSTRPIVSPLPIANIQWQVLDTYCQVLNEELGSITAEAKRLDGWLGWEGSLGARVLSGICDFENGRCRFTLMEVDKKLVDVLVETDDMPEDWFHGPSSQDEYIARSEELVRKLISGDAAAHQLFSPRYYEEITPGVVQELSDSLRELLGTQIVSAELKQTSLSSYDAESRSKRLSVTHAFSMADAALAVSTVQFVFPCGPNVISRGELAAIDVRKSWRSVDPDLVQSTHKAMETLFSDDSNASERFTGMLHPGLLKHSHSDAIADMSRQMKDEWRQLAGEPDWELWKIDAVGNNLRASGPLQVETGTIEARADFSERKLIGLTFLGPNYAVSTLDLLLGAEPAAKMGRTFWEFLFKRDLSAAHQLLAPAFREQLPLEQFQSLVRSSDLESPEDLKDVHLDTIRFAVRLERSVPVAFAAYYIAEFSDGSFQPVECEFWQREGDFELLTFNSDVEITFPVDGSRMLAKILEAFLSGDAKAVIQLAHEDERENFDPFVLDAFLKKLEKRAEGARIPERSSALHIYSAGNRTERLQALLRPKSGELRVDATLQLGLLKSFYFTSPELSRFAQDMQSVEGLEQLGNEFIDQWLGRDDAELAIEKMVSDLRRDDVVERLKKQGEGLESRHGPFRLSQLAEWIPSKSKNEVTCLFDLEFKQDTLRIEIVFEITAVNARIRSMHVLQPDA